MNGLELKPARLFGNVASNAICTNLPKVSIAVTVLEAPRRRNLFCSRSFCIRKLDEGGKWLETRLAHMNIEIETH